MKLDFRVLKEPGVLEKSSSYLFTPLPTAEKLYFYITQIGHYYCTHAYSIRRDYVFRSLSSVSGQAACV